jgi:tetratricopeptide (TPR) repeat protein
MLLARQGRHEEAIAAAGKALDLRPSMPGALQLAIHEISTGLADSERAAQFARDRVAKAKDDAVMTYQLASLEAELGRRKEALDLLTPICETDMPLPAALALRGLLLLETRDFSAARAALQKGIEHYADAVDLHYLLAQSWLTDPAHVKDGAVQEPARGYAIAELRAVIAVLKDHAPARNNLAWLLSRDEATRAEALEHAEAIVQRYPGYAPYLDTWGSVLLDLGRGAQAVTAFRQALGACEAERAALDKRAQAKLSQAETARVESLRKRLERVTAEVKAHYEAALKAPPGR